MAILTIDAGELESEPEALYAAAHRLHIACGGHAGDAASMARTLEAARRLGVQIGAHPSYEDRAGFGRATMAVSPDVLGAQVRAQCAALAAIARELGVPVLSAKMHGALYHDTLTDRQKAGAVLEAVVAALGPVAIVTQEGALAAQARARALRVLREGFADRAMRPDGRLVPRSEPGALIDDPAAAAAQAKRLVATGTIDAVCVHGDGPNALAVAQAVRRALAS